MSSWDTNPSAAPLRDGETGGSPAEPTVAGRTAAARGAELGSWACTGEEREVPAMPDHEDVRGSERAGLREEIARLQAEAERLRTGRGGADPEQVARLRAQVGQLAAQNDRLASTLRDARDQIVALKAEVDRLPPPPHTPRPHPRPPPG